MFKVNNKCPLCKTNTDITQWTTDRCTEQIPSYECESCDIVFADKVLNNETYIDFYNKYNTTRDTKNQEKEELRKKCYIIDKKFIIDNSTKTFTSVLDIGCGTGKFLSLFDQSQMRVGFDIDKDIIKINKQKYKDMQFVDSLDDIDTTYTFDLIIFRGTFQYMRDIDNIKTFIDNRLTSNGYLAILSLPNKNSPLANIQKEQWSLYNPIEMFNIFSIKAISTIFKNYDIAHIDFPYLDTPYSNEKEDLLKFIDIIKNKNSHKFPFWGSMMNIMLKK